MGTKKDYLLEHLHICNPNSESLNKLYDFVKRLEEFECLAICNILTDENANKKNDEPLWCIRDLKKSIDGNDRNYSIFFKRVYSKINLDGSIDDIEECTEHDFNIILK
ncbi:MAG: hypothetical protein WCR52_14850 [Bacteroidota bacterium]